MKDIDIINDLILKEGDYYSWIYGGLNCHIKRNSLKCWCGYVKIPNDTNIEYKEIDLNCHGGITYREEINDYFVIGFDCCHSGDLIPQYCDLGLLPGQKFDIDDYRTKEFVINEVNNMVDQILEIKSIRRDIRIDSLIG
jgi:hypothetical protein